MVADLTDALAVLDDSKTVDLLHLFDNSTTIAKLLVRKLSLERAVITYSMWPAS